MLDGCVDGLENNIKGPSKPPRREGFAAAHSQLVEDVFDEWNCYKDEAKDTKRGIELQKVSRIGRDDTAKA